MTSSFRTILAYFWCVRCRSNQPRADVAAACPPTADIVCASRNRPMGFRGSERASVVSAISAGADGRRTGCTDTSQWCGESRCGRETALHGSAPSQSTEPCPLHSLGIDGPRHFNPQIYENTGGVVELSYSQYSRAAF